MKKFIIIFLLLCVAVVFSGPLPTMAGEVDLLIKKLVEKKILTQEEATELIGEIQKEAAKEKKEIEKVAKKAATEVAKKEATAISLPKWVGKMKFKGDLRLRYEDQDLDTAGAKTETKRGRIRLRAGVVTNVNEKIKVGFGIATGGSATNSLRSTNQTLTNTFSTKSIDLDYAYVKHTPFKFLSLQGGKFKNPLFQPADLLWDSDIRPEGVAAKLKWNPNKGLNLSFIPAFFIIDDRTGGNDPNMWALEPGVDWKITDNIKLKAAGTYYGFSKIQGEPPLDETEGTNTFVGGNYRYDYDSFGFAADLGFSNLGIIPIPYLAVFGQYIENTDPNDDNDGYLFGIKFGNKKVKKFAQWQFKYMYRRLEKDAWMDSFPDADILGGDTNAKANEFIFKFGLSKNWSFALDYYDSKRLDINLDQEVLQLDLGYKF